MKIILRRTEIKLQVQKKKPEVFFRRGLLVTGLIFLLKCVIEAFISNLFCNYFLYGKHTHHYNRVITTA